ncbi:hypothetical protein [Lentzea sp. NPDC092896]|uniref:hypothetical protein n=1 Tax=Lentzea sp. NPDC092896 TaxID=3364127 RepID=UPI003830DAB8
MRDRTPIFLSCHFPPSPIAELCKKIADAVGLELITADAPRPELIGDKVRKLIEQTEATVVLWEDPRVDNPASFDWLISESATAQALGRPVAIVLAARTRPLPKSLPRELEAVDVTKPDADDNAIALMRYFAALARVLNNGRGDAPRIAYRRLAVDHLLRFQSSGLLQVETQIEILALRGNLADSTHSMYMNYKIREPAPPDVSGWPIMLIGLDSRREFRLIRVRDQTSKYTFEVGIDPPLKEGDTTKYGWRSPWLGYTPLSRNDIAPLSPIEDFLFGVDEVEHHWFVNHPTDRLSITLEFDTALKVVDFQAMSFVGRLFRKSSTDRSETARIAPFLSTNAFMDRNTVRLDVDAPLTGNTYVIYYPRPEGWKPSGPGSRKEK